MSREQRAIMSLGGRRASATGLGLAGVLLVPLLIASGAAAQNAAPELTFAVFGDCRPGSADFSPVLARLAADMAHQHPAFVMGTGDYIEGSGDPEAARRQFDGFFRGLAPLQGEGAVPVALAPGNHDIRGSRRNLEQFSRLLDGPYYSFDRAGCHFVILNTEEPGLEGRIAGLQLVWLKQDLKANAGKLTFVTLHQPLFPVDGHRGSSLDRYERERNALHRLFVQAKVACVFAGHEHLYNRQERDGVEYIITGGAGAPLYATPDKGGFSHYLLVFVRGNAYEVQVRRL